VASVTRLIGARQQHLQSSKQDTVGSAKVNFYLGASIRALLLSPNNTISVSGLLRARSEFKVYLRQETGTTLLLSRETPKRRIPLSLAYTLSGRTEATAVSFCARSPCTPIW